jgi:hypothetical protein
MDVMSRVLHWKRRRRTPLDPSDVAVAIRELEGLDWLEVRTSDELPVEVDALLA